MTAKAIITITAIPLNITFFFFVNFGWIGAAFFGGAMLLSEIWGF